MTEDKDCPAVLPSLSTIWRITDPEKDLSRLVYLRAARKLITDARTALRLIYFLVRDHPQRRTDGRHTEKYLIVQLGVFI